MTWAAKLARRRGAKLAMIALAWRIAVILHSTWKDDTCSAEGSQKEETGITDPSKPVWRINFTA